MVRLYCSQNGKPYGSADCTATARWKRGNSLHATAAREQPARSLHATAALECDQTRASTFRPGVQTTSSSPDEVSARAVTAPLTAGVASFGCRSRVATRHYC